MSRVVAAIESWVAGPRNAAARVRLAEALEHDFSLESVWLALAVVAKALPTEAEVRAGQRHIRNVSADSFVAMAYRVGSRGIRAERVVELLYDGVIVDVRHTAETELSTGIQRVARETLKQWEQDHDITLVSWTADAVAMRRLTADEYATALYAEMPKHKGTARRDRRIIVPIGGTYLLPELAAEMWRTERVSSLAQFANVVSGVIGFDCVPLTTAETVGSGMPGAFARNLTAVSHMSRIATISEAAAIEYRGWRSMLVASGLDGPDIQSVLLAAEPADSTDEDADEFAVVAELDELPLVLVVGSHEPRKNHLAVLQAAEILWNEGVQFRLVFVGGNSWNSLDFTDRVQVLRNLGRPVVTATSLPDRLLWAAYRLARFTVFTSINEGFGLPIAESVSVGTPVVTSNFGSMREVGEGNGALLVDPRDDSDIARGMRTLLDDEKEYARLVKEAEEYVPRTWAAYAEDVWAFFTQRAR